MTILQYITTVHFDHGIRRILPDELRKAGSARPLFVTDRGVIAAGVFAQATEAMPPGAAGGLAGGHPVFDETPVNPTEEAARRGAVQYKLHRCDGVVGIGGGAALDLAKAIAVLGTHK